MKRSALAAGVLLAVSLATSGCALNVRRYEPLARTAHVFNTNYEVGRRQTAYVGEVVVSVKDFVEKRRASESVRPTADFRVRQALSPWFSGDQARSYPIVGSLRHEGTNLRLVHIVDEPQAQVVVPVYADGRPLKKLILTFPARPMFVAGTATFEPADVRFDAGPELVSADSNAGFTNFELLYDGTDGRSFSLTYREYTPQDLVRPGFSQTVRYEASSPTIRFRSFVLKILAATSERLEYVVVSDGLYGERRAGTGR